VFLHLIILIRFISDLRTTYAQGVEKSLTLMVTVKLIFQDHDLRETYS